MKDCYPKYQQLNLKLNNKKMNQLRNEQKTLTDTSSKKIYRRKISIWKDVQHHKSLREIQIKTTMRYHYTHVKNAEYWQHEMLMRLWSHRNSNSLMMKMQNGIAALEDSLKILKKLNTLLPHHSVIMLLGIFPHDLKTYVHTDVDSKFIHNCPKLEATKMSFRRLLDK